MKLLAYGTEKRAISKVYLEDLDAVNVQCPSQHMEVTYAKLLTTSSLPHREDCVAESKKGSTYELSKKKTASLSLNQFIFIPGTELDSFPSLSCCWVWPCGQVLVWNVRN